MSGLIPQPFIDELLNRTDIVELIDGYVPLKKQGKDFVACCPFHNEKNPSFNVIPKKQFYHCFGCGVSGSAIHFLMNHLHLPFVEAVETLAARIGMTVPREKRATQEQYAPSHYDLLKQVSQFYQKTLKSTPSAIDYLKQRQVTGEIALRYQLGYAPAAWRTLEHQFKRQKQELIATGMLITKEDNSTYDRYRQRIIFPIHNRKGAIIGFGGRAIEASQKPKYINSPETALFQKNRELYGLYQATQAHPNLPYMLIVEGYMDVIALAQHGIPNAVATLGTATSTYHIQLLSKHTKRLIFCFDGDAAGRQAAWRALESALPSLNSGLEACFVFLPKQHDPDSLIRQEGKDYFLNLLDNATPLNQFFYSTLMQDIDQTSLAGKSQLVNASKPLLQKMPEGPYKQLLIDELARLTHIDSHRITVLLHETKHTAAPTEKRADAAITRTPARIATALLLQNPGLYAQCAAHIHPEQLDSSKHHTLQQLIQQVAHNPTIGTASLVEAWRDTPLFDALSRLATWDHQVPEQALQHEFIDTLHFLEKQNTQEIQIQQLLKKARQNGLTADDRLHLQKLLKQRHQGQHDSSTHAE